MYSLVFWCEFIDAVDFFGSCLCDPCHSLCAIVKVNTPSQKLQNQNVFAKNSAFVSPFYRRIFCFSLVLKSLPFLHTWSLKKVPLSDVFPRIGHYIGIPPRAWRETQLLHLPLLAFQSYYFGSARLVSLVRSIKWTRNFTKRLYRDFLPFLVWAVFEQRISGTPVYVPHVWSYRKMAAHMARKALYVYGAFCVLLFAKASYDCESKYLHFLRWLKTEFWLILKMEFEKRVKTILKFASRPRASTRLSRVTFIVLWSREKQIYLFIPIIYNSMKDNLRFFSQSHPCNIG